MWQVDAAAVAHVLFIAVGTVCAVLLTLHFNTRTNSRNLPPAGVHTRSLPRKIILIRHAESQGNVDATEYSKTPDSEVPLTARGETQALEAGKKIRRLLEAEGKPFKVFCIHSPYRRTIQTSDKVRKAFRDEEVLGVQEEVQLREQDFGGSFQDVEQKRMEQAERLRYGRFFYRFPNGESGADVYDRITILETHLIRDIDAGRFPSDTVVVLITHGLALRIFLMRWFHWTVEQMLKVHNPENAEPIVLECFAEGNDCAIEETKALYRLSQESQALMKGCEKEMCNSQRYHPLKSTKWVFGDVGGTSLARSVRVPSDRLLSETAAHTPSPVGTSYGIGSLAASPQPSLHSHGSTGHLHALLENQPLKTQLQVPGVRHTEGRIAADASSPCEPPVMRGARSLQPCAALKGEGEGATAADAVPGAAEAASPGGNSGSAQCRPSPRAAKNLGHISNRCSPTDAAGQAGQKRAGATGGSWGLTVTDKDDDIQGLRNMYAF